MMLTVALIRGSKLNLVVDFGGHARTDPEGAGDYVAEVLW
jgi:hypothetical protein